MFVNLSKVKKMMSKNEIILYCTTRKREETNYAKIYNIVGG